MEYYTVKLIQTKGYPIASVLNYIIRRECVSSAARHVQCTAVEKVFDIYARQVLTR